MANEKYRERVEVLIWRNGLVLMTVNDSPGGVWFGLPGGGIDQGESPMAAAIRETLEEVGIRLKDVEDTGEVGIKQGIPGARPDRSIMYMASRTYLYTGKFDGTDTSVLGIEGDSTDFKWVTPRVFAQTMREHYRKNAGGTGDHALRYIQRFL